MRKFPTFYFDGNKFFKLIQNEDDLKELRKIYPNCFNAKRAHLNEERNDPIPNFGYRIEHTGKQTLREYLENCGKELPILN